MSTFSIISASKKSNNSTPLRITTLTGNAVTVTDTFDFFIVNAVTETDLVTVTLPSTATNGRQYTVFLNNVCNGFDFQSTATVVNPTHYGEMSEGIAFSLTFNNGIYYISKSN